MGAGNLQTAFDRSLNDPAGFWGDAAEAVHWYKRWEKVLDDSRSPFSRWFVGGVVNTCHNALDRHVEQGRGNQLALIYDSPVTNSIKTFTYRELRDKVARFAGALARLGVSKGDRVIIYMPMAPKAAIAMLACARLGAVHAVVFGGFAANELAARIDDVRPKVVVSASCGVEVKRIVAYKPLLDHALRRCRLEGRGRLCLCHVKIGRYHQRGRTPFIDRRHGGSPGFPLRRGGVRRDRRTRRIEGASPSRFPGAQKRG